MTTIRDAGTATRQCPTGWCRRLMALPWGGHRRSSEWVRVAGPGACRRDGETRGRMAPLGLVERRADAGLVREVPAFAAGRPMGREVEAAAGAAKSLPRARPGGARSPLGAAQSNGRRERPRETRAGRIELAVPRLGKGGPPPSLLEPRRTAEKALVAVIREAHRHGVPTRAVDGLVRAMGGGGVSRSRSPPRPRSGVSRLRAEIDERVRAFLERRIEGRWPSLRLDATPALAGAGSAGSSARTAASRAAPPWWPPR